MKAIRVQETGSPDVLRLEEVERPEPGPGQVRVALEAAGLNFIDIYNRTGLYPLQAPFTPGREGAGVVNAVGAGVASARMGQRVAFVASPGAYAEEVVLPAERLVPVPESVDLEMAAAVQLQGMTAHYLATSTHPLGSGDTALVLAAAGGVGHLLVQVARRRGARVIGTTSTEEKAALVLDAGAREVIRYDEVDMAEEARRLTGGRGVDVVYDSVGKDTFQQSLDALRPRGCLVLYGQASGPVEPLDPQVLSRKGSLFLTRPTLADHVADREELLGRAADLFEWIQSGALKVRVDRRFPLAEAAEAHRYMEARKTKGKVLLVP